MTEPTPVEASQPQNGPGVIVEVAMRWGDMDVYGHINNVEVIRLLEEARIAAFGIPVGTGHQTTPPVVPLFDELPVGTQALIVEHRVKYVRPLEHRSIPARVRVRVVKAAGASLVLGLEVMDPVTGETCVRAHTQLAFFDPASGSVRRLSPAQRELLAPWQGPALFA